MIYFTAHTFKCVCHCKRAMFRVLGMYNFDCWTNVDRFHATYSKFEIDLIIDLIKLDQIGLVWTKFSHNTAQIWGKECFWTPNRLHNLLSGQFQILNKWREIGQHLSNSVATCKTHSSYWATNWTILTCGQKLSKIFQHLLTWMCLY